LTMKNIFLLLSIIRDLWTNLNEIK
jgi:hypothetical protein